MTDYLLLIRIVDEFFIIIPMLIKKLLKGQLNNVLAIVFWLLFLVLFTCLLFLGIIEKARSIENLNYITWIVVCIFQILNSIRKIRHIPSENNFNSDAKETIGIDKPIEKIALIVLVTTCLVPVLFIIWINRDALTSPWTIDPEYAVFDIYLSIYTGLLIVVQDVEDMINIQNKVVIQLLRLLGITLIITILVTLLIYSSHITEVSS